MRYHSERSVHSLSAHVGTCQTINRHATPMEMFLALLPMVYIFLSLFVLLECVLMLMTSTTETYFNCLIIKQGYRYHKIRN